MTLKKEKQFGRDWTDGQLKLRKKSTRVIDIVGIVTMNMYENHIKQREL